jgi:hypothetical protein
MVTAIPGGEVPAALLIQSATRVHVSENGNELLNLPVNRWPDP